MSKHRFLVTEKLLAIIILILSLFGIIAGTNWNSLVNGYSSYIIVEQNQQILVKETLSVSEMTNKLRALIESQEDNIEDIDYICSRLADNINVNSIIIGKFVYTKSGKAEGI